MRPLSVDDQDRKLRAECPQFRLVAHHGWMGIWEGTLTPICQTYRVRLVYFSRRFFEGYYLDNPYISVFVIDPPVGPDPRGTGEAPQHVYRLGHEPEFPRLCICDPVEDNWQPSEFLVDRIIPWIIKWFFFHEEWVASGEWKGGGRHPEIPEPCLRDEDLDPESRDRRERFRNAEFHRLGRKTGVFASYPLMVAASGESSLPQFWPSWSNAIPAEPLSLLASTLSPVPRPAGYSALDWQPDTPRANCETSMWIADTKSSHHSLTLRSAA